ncbi:phosphoribosylanthranilate isomerase [Metallumcola ferriviriculae]|uniref:N-(5'-phosphoribosyl)anthranilate isomerase n=1 Tax=Metallumcola ferriviriculae TaxID=3039180 RepID=A0AAU0UKN2_9FIRM|nr:phosphoribosylanthranilate isomerase [Desulfitibacteraceae bacterium MK1]
MVKPVVKICGITTAAQAKMVSTAGADAIGLVFAKQSTRFVSRQQASTISQMVDNDTSVVGVFCNDSEEVVAAAADFVSLSAVQLHGNESPDYCRRLREKMHLVEKGCWPMLVKAVPVRGVETLEQVKPYLHLVDAIMLDTYHRGRLGGTGMQFDWHVAVEFNRLWPEKTLLIAGGLNGVNVGTLLARINPWGVDVSSGVEAYPGQKSPEKVSAFIKQVKKGIDEGEGQC